MIRSPYSGRPHSRRGLRPLLQGGRKAAGGERRHRPGVLGVLSEVPETSMTATAASRTESTAFAWLVDAKVDLISLILRGRAMEGDTLFGGQLQRLGDQVDPLR